MKQQKKEQNLLEVKKVRFYILNVLLICLFYLLTYVVYIVIFCLFNKSLNTFINGHIGIGHILFVCLIRH